MEKKKWTQPQSLSTRSLFCFLTEVDDGGEDAESHSKRARTGDGTLVGRRGIGSGAGRLGFRGSGGLGRGSIGLGREGRFGFLRGLGSLESRWSGSSSDSLGSAGIATQSSSGL